MSTPKFTPGPWNHKRVPVYVPSVPLDGFTAFECAEAGGDEWLAKAKANATLISAGPEMYAALEAALLELEANKVAMHGPEWAAQRTMTGGALMLCARALAKAQGVQK